ncbi:S1C family serine protease [Effusibacillus lacus]|uniref:Serine protease n=1 Tax=Effusibacillus lacus TaxID=1348429 RepID=A0A292YJF3_9BACL|nr:trypsin-like peptidase domain-containing protein [Effusibacillus lacus]TCS74802.1 serine protease Do [Effusibacillus lacus]GAX88610.1 serine protease [Effusibacillus lacus]
MGFYDDSAKNHKRLSAKTWITLVVSASLLGSGTTTALMLPFLTGTKQIKLSQTNTALAEENPAAVQSVALNVNSEIIQAVNKAKPAVVTVVNLQNDGGRFYGNQAHEAGKGSGVVIDRKGHIVTNNHVVEGASQVRVLVNGQTVNAKILGTDALTDLAVLEIPTDKVDGIEPIEIGISESLQIGEPAIAIGNPLGEFEQTVTVGVISAKNRKLPTQDRAGNIVYEQTVLQTDAAINPGNSGGALVNVKGQLIGINSAKIASSGVEGLGFAIPIDEAKPIIEQLITNGKVIRPALGVSVSWEVKNIPANYRKELPVDYGVIVEAASGPAQKAGIESGDVIVQIDNVKINTFLDMRKYLFSKQPGDTVKVTFYRDSEERTVSVPLQELK